MTDCFRGRYLMPLLILSTGFTVVTFSSVGVGMMNGCAAGQIMTAMGVCQNPQTSADPAKNDREKIERAIANCSDRLYTCDFQKKYSEPYSHNGYDDMTNAAAKALFGVGSLVDLIEGHGTDLTDHVRTSFADEAKKRNLKPCQEICFAGCVTMLLLPYNDATAEAPLSVKNFFFKFESLERKIKEGSGICTDNSRLAHSLVEQVGILSKTIIIEFPHVYQTHALLEVELKHRRYLYEPDSCTFYRKNK